LKSTTQLFTLDRNPLLACHRPLRSAGPITFFEVARFGVGQRKKKEAGEGKII
jgi:hypothetical protein